MVWSLQYLDGGCLVTTLEKTTLLCAGGDHWVTAAACPVGCKTMPVKTDEKVFKTYFHFQFFSLRKVKGTAQQS